VKPPRIERSWLDGTSYVTLFSGGLDNPLAIYADDEGGKLYWADAGLGCIEFGNFDGANRRNLVRSGVQQPVGLTVQGRWLYWIEKEARQLERVDKLTGENRMVIETRLAQLSDLASGGELDEVTRLMHPCGAARGGCSHFCVSNGNGERRCSCPIGLTLDSQERTCKVPPTCKQDEFTCHSAEGECIPLVWHCDGTPECEDSSDELSCPTCAPNEFKCRSSSQCLASQHVCDRTMDCPDGSDESLCAPCDAHLFECHADRRCIASELVCNRNDDCTDGEDESAEVCHAVEGRPSTGPASSSSNPSSRSQYIVIVVIVVVVVVLGTIVLYLICYQRKASRHLFRKEHQHEAALIKPVQYKAASTSRGPASARIVTSFSGSSAAGGSGHAPSSASSAATRTDVASTPLYERGHITGASSSTSSAASRYPKDTAMLNPPPSPVTDDRSCCDGDAYASSSNAAQSVGLLRQTSAQQAAAARHAARRKRTKRRKVGGNGGAGALPPPTTPCSTDVCEESEAGYSAASSNGPMYYCRSDDELEDPFCPPPPTPHSRCLSDVTSQPPSPCTERSFFNPYPPPPSPMAMSDC
jgi:low density lipoprotein receptor-related protein 5/6